MRDSYYALTILAHASVVNADHNKGHAVSGDVVTPASDPIVMGLLLAHVVSKFA